MASTLRTLHLVALVVLATFGGTLVLAAPPAAAMQCGSVGSSCCTTAFACVPGCQGGTVTSCIPPITCATITEDTVAAGLTYSSCDHVSGYVCVPTWYGGNGLLGGFVCRYPVYLA